LAKRRDPISCACVVDDAICLRGVLTMRDWMLAPTDQRLGAINGVVTAMVACMARQFLPGACHRPGHAAKFVFAGLAGASIPLLMRRLGLDPAQSSNIILTTVTDLMGFMVF
jgi:magnesium transporter